MLIYANKKGHKLRDSYIHDLNDIRISMQYDELLSNSERMYLQMQFSLFKEHTRA